MYYYVNTVKYPTIMYFKNKNNKWHYHDGISMTQDDCIYSPLTLSILLNNRFTRYELQNPIINDFLKQYIGK